MLVQGQRHDNGRFPYTVCQGSFSDKMHRSTWKEAGYDTGWRSGLNSRRKRPGWKSLRWGMLRMQKRPEPEGARESDPEERRRRRDRARACRVRQEASGALSRELEDSRDAVWAGCCVNTPQGTGAGPRDWSPGPRSGLGSRRWHLDMVASAAALSYFLRKFKYQEV